jgi:C4-dicarboxylate-specific signal transduction histidine kinase
LLVIRGGSELRRSNTLLQTELADGLPPVAGDRIQLQQVMLNFILNAVEAMSESSEIRRELLIRTDRDNTGAWSSAFRIPAPA